MERRTTFDDVLETIPIARWGFYELQAVAIVAFLAAAAIGWQGPPWAIAAILPIALAWAVAWFYRDPPRDVTNDPSAFLAPADGKVVAVDELEHYGFFGGPATRIGVFLSVFDVHINRAPRAALLVEKDYRPGEHRNTLFGDSADRNEAFWTGWEDAGGARFAVRQIAGLIARRIVCDVEPGDRVATGHKFGMIKFGSRTELIVPAGVEVTARVGDRVRGGVTVLARTAEAAP